ncbi:MAG: hypothetical protein ACHQAV_06465 [Solirubrobacterales bacterium]
MIVTGKPGLGIQSSYGPTQTERTRYALGEKCPPETFGCGFPRPAEEPAGIAFPPSVEAEIVGRQENGDPVTGYEGPTSWFTGITSLGSFATGRGVVNFSPALAPGESTYFSLESPPVGGFGSATALATTLSGGGQSGASIKVVQGTPVTDTATLSGGGAASATGPVSFAVYSDSECKSSVAAAGSAKLSGGSAGPSSAESLAPGKYYWQAHYAGTLENQAVSSVCGSEVLTVLAPTTTTTTQAGGGVTGASITVQVGTSVSDQAMIAGSLAKTASGTVSYALYKDSKCTVPVGVPSTGLVLSGAAGPSAAVKPGVGKYYWLASYGGDAANAPSASACGAEILTVARKLNLGLRASSKTCVSKRRFVVHPRAPKGVRFVKLEVLINGKLARSSKLSGRHTTVNLRGLPKGTFRVALIVTSSTGQVYEDVRTFHTCVAGHHKKK